MKTLTRRLSRTGVWTSLGLVCSLLPLTFVTPLAWYAVAVNVVAAVVVLALPEVDDESL